MTDLTPQVETITTVPDAPAAEGCGGQCGGGCACGEPKSEHVEVTRVQPKPDFREITLRVPLNVSDQQVDMAMGMGSLAFETIMQQGLIIYFPTVQVGQDGKKQRAIGQAVVPLLNPSDLQRIMKVCEAIATANAKIMQARQSGVPGAQLEAAITGEVHKDNVARDETAKAQGYAGGIIVDG